MGSISRLSAAARRLEGKVAIITGGASGLGECTARHFAKHGAKVVIADIQDDKGHAVCKDLDPISACFVHCDVTKENDVENAVKTAVSKYGKLDIMCNNAGTAGVPKPNILDNDLDEFESIIKINLVGTFLGTKHAAKVMMPARYGSIINTASIAAIVGGSAGHAYTSSKHGVVGLMRNSAVDLGRYGIRVNCVSPYLVATSMAKEYFKVDDDAGLRKFYQNLNGTLLKSEDVAEAMIYLGSDESKYVSGHNLVVDGGFTIMNSSICMFKLSD